MFPTSLPHPIAFLGAGNMAEAIARALLNARLAAPADIRASDPSPERRALFSSLGAQSSPGNASIVRHAKVVLLCCKPQYMRVVVESVRDALPPDALLISIAAGMTIDNILAFLGRPHPIVRAMPNTPLMANAGMTALSPSTLATPQHLATARAIFESAGKVVDVPESLLDAVTAVSGSGPAYYFLLTEHLARAATDLGFDPATADLLARQTALGSALMLSQSSDSSAELRRKVTSPGGTTQAAIEHMERHALPQTFRDAVAAACRRGAELRALK
jgi:pyrroline-5-carboxylate reductase